jgi:hypothetical protein
MPNAKKLDMVRYLITLAPLGAILKPVALRVARQRSRGAAVAWRGDIGGANEFRLYAGRAHTADSLGDGFGPTANSGIAVNRLGRRALTSALDACLRGGLERTLPTAGVAAVRICPACPVAATAPTSGVAGDSSVRSI